MSSEIRKLHIFFLPFMAHGHMIPTMDMAKLFASHGVKTTIVTTPLNAPLFCKTIERSKNFGVVVDIKIIKFPSAQVGLPEGFERMEPSKEMDVINKFFLATSLLQEPLEQLLQEFKPDCLVADLFFPWATDAAKKFGIPRLVFQGTSFFSMCIMKCLRLYEPYQQVESDAEPFVVPNLPGEVELTRKKLPDFMMQETETETDFTKMLKACKESEVKSYGVVVNSFYELEAIYADFYRNFLGTKAWHIGPVALCNRGIEDKVERGKKASVDEHECLKWLDSKKSNSVVYICFGSMANFTSTQLKEIAMGLEASGQEFIWVVRLDKGNEEEEWLPRGFEERMEGKGLIIRGWAPQVLILEHSAIGGFVTHCGWNSILESVSAGVPMVTWPIAAEQFFNEKLVIDILRIGAAVGAKEWVRVAGDFVNKDAIEKAVKAIMVGEKGNEMRSRAKAFGEMAKRAIEKDGSSYSDLKALIQELSLCHGH